MLLTILHYALAVLLLTFSACVIALNAACIYAQVVRQKYSSWIPLVGGIAGMIGCLIFPHGHLRSYWWLPLILDYGCMVGMTHTLVFYTWRWWKNRRARPSS